MSYTPSTQSIVKRNGSSEHNLDYSPELYENCHLDSLQNKSNQIEDNSNGISAINNDAQELSLTLKQPLELTNKLTVFKFMGELQFAELMNYRFMQGQSREDKLVFVCSASNNILDEDRVLSKRRTNSKGCPYRITFLKGEDGSFHRKRSLNSKVTWHSHDPIYDDLKDFKSRGANLKFLPGEVLALVRKAVQLKQLASSSTDFKAELINFVEERKTQFFEPTFEVSSSKNEVVSKKIISLCTIVGKKVFSGTVSPRKTFMKAVFHFKERGGWYLSFANKERMNRFYDRAVQIASCVCLIRFRTQEVC